MAAGLQVPLMPLLEVAGNAGAVAPTHRSAIGSKVGVICGVTVTVSCAVAAQVDPVGVNV